MKSELKKLGSPDASKSKGDKGEAGASANKSLNDSNLDKDGEPLPKKAKKILK